MDRPIFIIGSGRSGTTLLRNMLNAHPRIHIAFEPHFYWYRALFRTRRPARELLDFYFQSPHFRWQRVDPNRVLAQLPSPLGREHLGEAFAAVLRERAARYGRVRFGDKTPANAAALKTIFADFPECRAIHIVRDPRATAASLARMPWAPASLMINASYLDIERKQVAKFRDRMLPIRLEDLLAEPRATMTRVLDFVEEPWHDDVLDHARHQPDKDDVPPYPWLERAGGVRDDAGARGGAAGAGWGELTPVQIRMIEQITKRVMAGAGYKPAELAKEPRWISVFWAGISEIPRFFPLAARGLWLWFKARKPERLDWAERYVLTHTNPAAWARYPGYELPTAPPLAALTAGDMKTALPSDA
ncbi:MAG TPA: sulfotransferase [Kofleriaceae bacterium]|nr:sulfotransferase [Kofleriaceae bacterium]